MSNLPKVFISSTSADLSHCRDIVFKALMRGNTHMPVEQKDFTPTHKTVRDMLRETIEGCDAMIHIIGKRYGMEESERAVPRISYTQTEYEIAKELDLPIYTFVCAENFEYSPCEPESPEKQELQRAYREKFIASEKRVFTWIKNPRELEPLIIEVKSKIKGRESVLNYQRELVKDLAWAYDEKIKIYRKKVPEKAIWEDALKSKARQEGITVAQLRKEIAEFIATVESPKNAARVDWDDQNRVNFLKKREQVTERKWQKIALVAGVAIVVVVAVLLFNRLKTTPTSLVLPKNDVAAAPSAPKQEVNPSKVVEVKAAGTSKNEQPSSPFPVVKEEQKVAERPIVQPKEYQNAVSEENIITFAPAGTLLIKTKSGEEIRAILNTVSGFPVSFYLSGTEKELELDSFARAEFSYQYENNWPTTATIRTYDNNNKETILLKDYKIPSYSNMGAITFLADKGMRFLLLDQVEQMTKNESTSPKMSEYVRYAYIRSKGMVYKVPQPLLKYTVPGMYGTHTVYYGFPRCGNGVFGQNSLKYIRICKEVDGFAKTYNSIFANVYFTDNSMVSIALPNSSLIAPTALGNISPGLADIDEIFFGAYDVDFAKKVATKAWDKNNIVSLTPKGTATVYKNDGTKSVLATNSLVAIGSLSGQTNSSAYLKTDYGGNVRTETDVPPLFFGDIKSLKIKNNDKKLTADYLLYSGETGGKRILDYELIGLSENGNETINWSDIDRIDFDSTHSVDLSGSKKAIVVDKNGCIFETFQTMLNFGYIYSSGGIPSMSAQQTVKVEGGLSITYDKIKKIELLPQKKEGDTVHYPAKITLRTGGTPVLNLDIGGYYWTHLQFLTSLGVLDMNLRDDVQSIEFMD